MATGAELHDPGSVLLSVFLWPFFDVRVPEIGCWIAPMTTSTGEAVSKMHILDDFFEIRMTRRSVRFRSNGEECIGRVVCRIAMAEKTIVLQHQFHLLWTQL